MSEMRLGRPPATSHAEIERIAFTLFEERGFDATTVDDIAAELGIGRRTLFRYYPSKNDILWGQFDDSLDGFAKALRATARSEPLGVAIRNAILDFNRLDPTAVDQHRQRMRLLLDTPVLMAHSELRYAASRAVVAEFVAERTGGSPKDATPATLGRIALALALSAYEQWLRSEDDELEALLVQAFQALAALSLT